ncbi:nuclear transport factor 2 family protein [Marivirga sp. S37H4]|uniref:Nuclear transport factor 2 family protein n=1 Tax=Marivirga aurantiaca TaxID=2802615 RepID=A0A934WY04_9BACT|nr:nuclear transport factor 2 family protein [Marivirga aurantiaca]MBK6265229.1 nuclear transport factor 2 family protein [Marivirga aurantiaca]
MPYTISKYRMKQGSFMLLWMIFIGSFSLKAQVNSNDSLHIQQEILKRTKEMTMLFNSKQLDQIAQFYTSDSKMIGPRTNVSGDQMKTYWPKFSNANNWELENIEIQPLSLTFASQIGISTIEYTRPDGNVAKSITKFSLIWQKTNEGWKIKQDFFFPIPQNE